jgi:hypothetical protein
MSYNGPNGREVYKLDDRGQLIDRLQFRGNRSRVRSPPQTISLVVHSQEPTDSPSTPLNHIEETIQSPASPEEVGPAGMEWDPDQLIQFSPWDSDDEFRGAGAHSYKIP